MPKCIIAIVFITYNVYANQLFTNEQLLEQWKECIITEVMSEPDYQEYIEVNKYRIARVKMYGYTYYSQEIQDFTKTGICNNLL